MTSPGDSFALWWDAQRDQQFQLGLDPEDMTALERERVIGDLVRLLYEEVTELSSVSPSYKLHLLNRGEPDAEFAAEEIADIIKTTLALAQTFGLKPIDIAEAFNRKTQEVKSKFDAERRSLTRDTKLVCVDLDDVLVDLEPFRTALLGTDVEAPPADKLQVAEDLKDRFYRKGGFREMRPVDGAPEAMRVLKMEGYTIVIITARPQWQYKRLYGDTLAWLDHHDVPHDLILFNKDKVEALHQYVTPAWPVAFVEDHERNAKALASAGVRVLLYDQAHNRDVPETDKIRRVKNWREVLEELT